MESAVVGVSSGVRVWRFEVRARSGVGDARGERLRREAERLGVRFGSIRSASVYLIEGAIGEGEARAFLEGALVDPVKEEGHLGALCVGPGEVVVEVLPLPGVMDPAAGTVEMLVREVLGAEMSAAERSSIRVTTGVRYDIEHASWEEAERVAWSVLANPVVQGVHREPVMPERLPEHPPVDQSVRHVEVLGLDDAGLERLSRDGHLFLDLEEMRALQSHFVGLDREPTDLELETVAQTWSEHCVHKTMKSRVRYRVEGGGEGAWDSIDWSGRSGIEMSADGTVVIDNLLKRTVAAATFELIEEGLDWTLSVFVDNAGVVRFDDAHAVCMKVETHNRPSAIEPYGGAATGIGGCIRDVMGTGLVAKPIASTDVFCVAPPFAPFESGGDGFGDWEVPAGCLPPRRVLTEVVAGIRDYGNRMGIPTVNGSVHFDPRYVGNPLVYCGCIGVMPIPAAVQSGAEVFPGSSAVVGEPGFAASGDLIVAVGGRTGKDGIHGATFSSGEMTDTHADEFSHAVQIGNAIEEKRVLDALLRAREAEGGALFRAVTDCGAGGFSSAVGEMGELVGARVELRDAPLKYSGLRYDEIWISESQERMVLAVPSEKLDALRSICEEEGVEAAVLGMFGQLGDDGEPELLVSYGGEEVGRLSMAFMHDGLPKPEREALWRVPVDRDEEPMSGGRWTGVGSVDGDWLRGRLLDVLRDPNVASKRWIVSQYDYEVQGNTVGKPMVGVEGRGPGDGSVVQPVAGSERGLAIGNGLALSVGDPALGGDPYLMAFAGVDECVRNLVCSGADPDRIAVLDNFCWASCAEPENMGGLVRASVGCYDAAKVYRTPFVSGKDSLNNQFRKGDGCVIEIPPTLLISGMGVVPDVGKCVTSGLVDRSGTCLFEIGPIGWPEFGWPTARRHGADASWENESVDWHDCRLAAVVVHRLMLGGMLLAAHDVSDGGVLTSVAEMVISGMGSDGGSDGCAGVDLDGLSVLRPGVEGDVVKVLADSAFAEGAGRYLVQAEATDPEVFVNRVEQLAGRVAESLGFPPDDVGIECRFVGSVRASGEDGGSGLRFFGGEDVGLDHGAGELLFEVGAAELRAAFESTFEGW